MAPSHAPDRVNTMKMFCTHRSIQMHGVIHGLENVSSGLPFLKVYESFSVNGCFEVYSNMQHCNCSKARIPSEYSIILPLRNYCMTDSCL